MKRKGDLIGITHALNGFFWAFREQLNLRIHCIITLSVIIAGLIFRVSITEWLFIASAIALVFLAEFINTSIEQIGNAITTQYNESIKHAKDVGAAAVLISALYASTIGIAIFIPKIL